VILRILPRFTCLSWITLLLTACTGIAPVLPAQPQPEAPATPTQEVAGVSPSAVLLEPTGFTRTIHDPVMAHEGGAYYVFSTGTRIMIVCSPDKVTWEFCGRVFEENPAWTHEVNPQLGDTWAPDISYFNGKWHLYYAVSSFGSQNSAIGLATNATLNPQSPDYAWQDQGVVLRSRPGDQWNAIDPNLVLDESGEPWLAWGSFWHGIWMRKIDASTGKFSDAAPDFIHLADRSTGADNTSAIEAAFIVPHDGKWYLFVSFDQCCQGAASTYNVRVGRAESLQGPYVDREGVPLLEGGGTRILEAYDVWRGPGHNGMLIEDGVYWTPYHAYHAQLNGTSHLRIESIDWSDDGWPELPSQTP